MKYVEYGPMWIIMHNNIRKNMVQLTCPVSSTTTRACCGATKLCLIRTSQSTSLQVDTREQRVMHAYRVYISEFNLQRLTFQTRIRCYAAVASFCHPFRSFWSQRTGKGGYRLQCPWLILKWRGITPLLIATLARETKHDTRTKFRMLQPVWNWPIKSVDIMTPIATPNPDQSYPERDTRLGLHMAAFWTV